MPNWTASMRDQPGSMDQRTIHAGHRGKADPLRQAAVELTSSSSSWVALLDAGGGDFTAVERVPATDSFVVIVGGHAYLVEAPSQRVVSGGFPEIARSAVPIPEMSLVIVEGDTEIAGFDAVGLRWRSGRLSWDGLRLRTPWAGKLEGEGWDAPSDTWVSFSLDLRNGRAEGGTRPPTEVAEGTAPDHSNRHDDEQ
jgi:hypothetical protein